IIVQLFSSATKTPECSHVYCLVVWRSVRRSRTVACDSCVSPGIVEATGWVINEKGEVILTADASTTALHGSWQNPASCRAS
ncbi:MAG: hypothetical protein KME57_36240, partial [Scytonema hyalinum WJT4-NPBG1]|nr:hypothetical protein [Scytonema hyalinum WJT4-NPBG1]